VVHGWCAGAGLPPFARAADKRRAEIDREMADQDTCKNSETDTLKNSAKRLAAFTPILRKGVALAELRRS
jgi:hypothetical protein